MDLVDYIHEFHPYDALFIVPVVVSGLLFWKHRRSAFGFGETLFGAVVATTIVTVGLTAILEGAWSLIGITTGLVVGLYVPVCLAVGLITTALIKRTRPA